MNNAKSQLTQFLKKFDPLARFVAQHTILVFFLIASLAILAALLQSRSYLNPSRDEERYNTGIAEIQYKTIDEETLQSLLNTEKDPEIQVNPELVPGRDNPFAE